MTPYAADPRDLAAELSPDGVGAYLTSKGYARVPAGERISVYTLFYDIYAKPGEEWCDGGIEVPLDPTLSDYGRRMLEALDALDGAFLGLLHAIDPDRFPRERILALAGVAP